MKIVWSASALADLDRFATFLHERYPGLAAIVAREIIAKTSLLETQPRLGHPIAGREEYRQVVLRVLRARYVFRYRIDVDRIVMLRVFHSREAR